MSSTAWRIRVYNNPRAPRRGASNESLYKLLVRQAHDPLLISFFPTGQDIGTPTVERFYVRISSLTSMQHQAPTLDGSPGWFELVVTEVVMSQDLSAGGIYPVA